MGGGNPSYNIIKVPSEIIHNNIIYKSDLNGNIESKGKIWNLAASLNPYILLQNNVMDDIFIFDCVKYLTYGYNNNANYLSKT